MTSPEAAYKREWRRRTGRTSYSLPATPTERKRFFLASQQHGTPGRYNKGCHCFECREAIALRQRQYRETGSTRGYRTRPERKFVNRRRAAA